MQQEVLRQCLEPNEATAFGREHEFARLANLADYQAAVPIRSYPELAPWIERSAAGEPAILTAEDPIRFWKTTGTTAVPKKIPVTPASVGRTMESFLTLSGTQLHYYPELNERSDTSLVTHLSPKTIKEFLGPRRVPYCTTTELPIEVRRRDFSPPWLPGLQDVVEDDAERLYYLLAYAAAHDLLSLACLHPSRFVTVSATLQAQAARLLDELAHGTVLGRPVRDPQPERARLLRRQPVLRARDLWPNLRFLTSWSGSYLSRYRARMESEYCSGFLPTPSISSEAFLTMTVDEDPISQPLNLRGGVFEFVPLEGGPARPFYEVEPGQTYEVILTTLSGLYRYASRDLFRVTGFCAEVPRLEYVGRRSVTDLTGEKLAEEQVVEALRDLPGNWTVCGRFTQPPGYVLLVEGPAPPAEALDERLKALNSRYELKRNFGDLAPLAVHSLAPGTFERYRQARVGPAGQLKDLPLQPAGSTTYEELLACDR